MLAFVLICFKKYANKIVYSLKLRPDKMYKTEGHAR